MSLLIHLGLIRLLEPFPFSFSPRPMLLVCAMSGVGFVPDCLGLVGIAFGSTSHTWLSCSFALTVSKSEFRANVAKILRAVQIIRQNSRAPPIFLKSLHCGCHGHCPWSLCQHNQHQVNKYPPSSMSTCRYHVGHQAYAASGLVKGKTTRLQDGASLGVSLSVRAITCTEEGKIKEMLSITTRHKLHATVAKPPF